MVRVVLDTNIFISALLQPAGPPAQVFVLALAGSIRMCISAPIFAEYEEVIRRPRFGRKPEQIEAALGAVRDSSLWVRPMQRIRACSDPDDNVFLECAAAAEAHFLISGNLRHFPSEWDRVRIVTARQFLELNLES